MAGKPRCKVCHCVGANIGPDHRCCGCRMAYWATLQGLRYGNLMAQLHAEGIDPEDLSPPDLPPVRDTRRHYR